MELARGALAGMAARVLGQLIAFAVVLIAARYLGPADFGVFTIAAAMTTVIRTALYTGSFEFLLKTSDLAAYAGSCLAASLACAVALSGLAGLFAIVAIAMGAAHVGWLAIILLPSNAISAVASWLEAQILRQRRIGRYYSVLTVAEIIAATGAVTALYCGLSIYALVVQIYLRSIVASISYAGMINWRAGWRPDRLRVAEVIRWSLPRYADALATSSAQYSADVLLGLRLSALASGLYRAAGRLTGAASDVLHQPFRIMTSTKLSQAAANGDPLGPMLVDLFEKVSTISWSVLVVFAVLADWLVPTLLGDAWRTSAAIVPYLAFAAAMSATASLFMTALVCANRQAEVFTVNLAASVIQIATVAALLPLGVGAVAGGVAAVSLLTTCTYTWRILRLLPEIGPALGIAALRCGGLTVMTWLTVTLVFKVTDKGPWTVVLASSMAGLAVLAIQRFIFRQLPPMHRQLGEPTSADQAT